MLAITGCVWNCASVGVLPAWPAAVCCPTGSRRGAAARSFKPHAFRIRAVSIRVAKMSRTIACSDRNGSSSQDGYNGPERRVLLHKFVQEVQPQIMEQFTQQAPQQVVNAMRQTITNMLGTLPPQFFGVTITTIGENLAQLMFSMMMTGYMFRNAQYRLEMRNALALLPTSSSSLAPPPTPPTAPALPAPANKTPPAFSPDVSSFFLPGLPINNSSNGTIAANGNSLNATPVDNTSLSGSSLNDTALNGTSPNGSSLNRTSLNGTSVSETSVNGIPFNGTSINGTPFNGTSINGTPLNGASLNGTPLSGTSLNGASVNGVSLDGASVSGTSVTGSSFNGGSTDLTRHSLSSGRGFLSDEEYAPGVQKTRVAGEVLRWHHSQGVETRSAVEYIEMLEAEVSLLRAQVPRQGGGVQEERNELLDYVKTLEPLNLQELTATAEKDAVDAMHTFIHRLMGTADKEDLRSTNSECSAAELAKLMFWLMVVGYSLRATEVRLDMEGALDTGSGGKGGHGGRELPPGR